VFYTSFIDREMRQMNKVPVLRYFGRYPAMGSARYRW